MPDPLDGRDLTGRRRTTSTAVGIMVIAVTVSVAAIFRLASAGPALEGRVVPPTTIDGRTAVVDGFDMEELRWRLTEVDGIELDDLLVDAEAIVAVHTASQLDYDLCRADFDDTPDESPHARSRVFAC